MLPTVFDVGMYDGADTAYYLEKGHRVVAVEANPNLIARANQRFAPQVASGALTLVNAAIGPDDSMIELVISGDDLGGSSTLRERVVGRNPIGSFRVGTTSLDRLINNYGVPYYLKVDIEGSDRLCVLAITKTDRPAFLSFEVGDDMQELTAHAASIGYTRFRLVNQCNFRELARQRMLMDRVTMKIVRHLGYDKPRLIKRAGRYFVAGHSSGPVPWTVTGRWYTAPEIIQRWDRALAAGGLGGWYDLHAA